MRKWQGNCRVVGDGRQIDKTDRTRKLYTFKKGHRPKQKPMNNIVDDDLPWGNNLKNKEENKVRIFIENVNNIVSMTKGNHKLDQEKIWLIWNNVNIA